MTRTGVRGVVLFSCLASAACAQVIGIGNPETCAEGTDYCDGGCVDLRADPKNCGTCGNSCKGASCVSTPNGVRPGMCVDSNCTQELATCGAPASGSVDCHGLDCVEFAALPNPVCLRRCRTNDDCPFETFCAPRAQSSYVAGFTQFAAAGGHCVPSFCGGQAGSWYFNGAANDVCQVGGEAYLGHGAVATKPGTCWVVAKNSPGICYRSGTVPPSYDCTLNPTGCVDPQDFHACTDGHVCLGTASAAKGTCYQVCDPRVSGQCPSGYVCGDKSGGNKTAGACEWSG